MKAPEVGGAGVPAVLKEGQSGPHPGAPLRPTGSVPGSGLNIPDVPVKDMEPGIQIPFRACGESAFLRVVRASVDPAVDLLDLSAKVAKLRQHFRLEERNRHGDHGQGQNAAGVLDGLVRVRDYGVQGSSHVLLQKKESPCSGLLRFAGFGYIPHIPCVAHIFGAMPADRSDNMRCYAQPFCMVWWSPDISTMVDYSRKFPGEWAWKQVKAAPYDSLFPFRLIRRRNAPF